MRVWIEPVVRCHHLHSVRQAHESHRATTSTKSTELCPTSPFWKLSCIPQTASSSSPRGGRLCMRKPKRSPRHWRSQRRSQHPSCFRRFCHPSRQRSPPRPNRHSTLYPHRNTSNFAPPPARSPTCREQWTFSRGLTRPWKKPILSRKMGPMRMCWKLDCCRLRWRGRLFRRRRTSDIYSWMLAYKQEVDCHYPLPVLTSGGPLYTPP